MNEILNRVDELAERYFSVWEDICNIESPTNYKVGVDKVGQYFSSMAKERGWKIEYLKQDVSGDVVCITMNQDSEADPITLSGHIDTVHSLGSFGNPAVKRDGEKIYGPGVTDCKGGVVAGFLAMDALFQNGYNKRPIRLLLQTDEETGSKTSDGKTIEYICEKSKDSVLFLNLESYSSGGATMCRKGIVSYRFDIMGIEGHSARCATVGANAVVDAAHKIIELDKFKDKDGITCNCATVSGGTVLNTIPGKCTFSVNFRFATEEQFDLIENFVKTLASTEHVHGCKCTCEKINSRPAMEKSEKNLKALQKVNEIFAEYGMPVLEARTRPGGSDAAYITQCGIPCIDSLGTSGGNIHTADEFAKLDSLLDAAKRIIVIAYKI